MEKISALESERERDAQQVVGSSQHRGKGFSYGEKEEQAWGLGRDVM